MADIQTSEFKIPRVPEVIDFAKEEEKILKFWEDNEVFKTCLKQSKGKPRFSFYDGPPFATGLPHYGHILAGTIKDVVTRYAHQQGFHVERRFGWDCHGLPVEFEIDKTLGIKGPEDVMKMGIDKYNYECRSIVMRYADDWEKIIGRMGRWIDFKNDYKTLYPWYMESIWWVFKELYNKGLVYQGVKVMPFSTACNTPLSNFESGQNYKDTVDPAVVIAFPKIDNPNESFLAWTTTPWTLPSNLALCVNPALTYVKVKDLDSNRIFILLEKRLEVLYKQPEQYEILESFPGIQLKDVRYKPLFPYFEHRAKTGAFRVLIDDYVSEESGTGIVHQAPYFGEDDYRVNLANGIISRDEEPLCPVDESGCFTLPVKDFLGLYVKDADKKIIEYLKNTGRLIQHSQTKHSYPFCWRSDTPLIYKAVPSWFIRVEHMQEALLKSSSQTYWVPEVVKDKRFGNWLREARDWAVSRNRYWGTPIPLWISDDREEIVCVGSIEELNRLTGGNATDLHRENIDHLVIPSRRPNHPPLKRVSEVFDCWFESGSMPYAQQHYPFEHQKEFEDCFPAHFIAEGIDQTRGWFYTLLVISTALFNKPPFKNLIANGLVLASDGQKMSKRKKNYPNPVSVVEKYGADALRLYLINSPVVRAENLRFKEEGVRDIIKDVFLPWFNAFRFLMQNIESYVQNTGKVCTFQEQLDHTKLSDNKMDRWILSYTQSLLAFVKKEMAAYHLYTVVPRLTKFIDNLTNWYVRMNRKRLKGDGGNDDCKHALNTLFNVLLIMVKIMAPFAPFLSELIYQYLFQITDKYTGQDTKGSVHYLMFPNVNKYLIDETIERSIARMQIVIELGRVLRDRKTIPIKYPLPELVVIHRSTEFLNDIKSLEPYILSELNVKKLTLSSDKEKYGIKLRAEPDHKTLGLRLKLHFKAVTQAIKELTDTQVEEFIKNKSMDITGHKVDLEEIRIILETSGGGNNKYEANSDNDTVILLDVTPDQSMLDEGIAREIINRVQKLRKKAHLVPTDDIDVYYETSGELLRISKSHTEFIESTIKASFKQLNDNTSKSNPIIEESQLCKGENLKLVIVQPLTEISLPVLKWVNVALINLKPRFGNSDRGTLLLETFDGKFITLVELRNNISNLFGIYKQNYNLWLNNKEVTTDNDLKKASGQTIYVCPITDNQIKSNVSSPTPFSNFVNVKFNNRNGTVLIENGLSVGSLSAYLQQLFNIPAGSVSLSKLPKSGETLNL
ncbi:isoleucine--tRNA ligase, cytoplasmic [Chrysoperla carnea]|uniref:isoleucine--tRNA ligase, cytoplasmic n=1 Tax=Chrysoperla carnea TaxID=189513 RepID=UPI001D08FAD0|nr:isoleucine--tRNA ligase, cytoplasmic [Chrysoperla carnea]